MGLEDLEKNLYKPEAEFQNRPENTSDFSPGAVNQVPSPAKQWEEKKPKPTMGMKFSSLGASLFSFNQTQKKYFLIIGIVLLVLIIGLMAWIYYKSPFDANTVELGISGPEKVSSGEAISYIARIKNNNKLALTGIELIFSWPENSIPDAGSELIQRIPVDDIPGGATKEVEFKGKIIGLKGATKEIKATINYQPKGIKAKYAKDATFSTGILSVPLVLSFDMPDRVTSGQQITVALKYLNDSDSVFDNLVMKIEYPEGFKVSSTYPQPQENAWQIGTLQPKDEGKVLLTGTIEGNRGDAKSFKGYLGVIKDGNFVAYSDAVKSAQISLPALSLMQKINDADNYIASPGETLNYKIKYQNNSTLGIPAIKIVTHFDTKILDFFSLDLKGGGNFDSVANSITWDQTNTKGLDLINPGQSGELNFTVKVFEAERMPIKNFGDKNFAAVSVTSIDSSSIPLALIDQQVKDSLQMVTKINSKITIKAKGYYQDSYLSNSGPIPPTVGQTTTYSVHWDVTNSANDVDEVKVEAILPSYVEWVNNYKPASAILNYDTLTRKLTWNIGKVTSGTGILAPAKTIVFQLALTPSSTQLNQVVELLKISTISGKDSYTSTALNLSDKSVTTDCPDDPTMSWEKGLVRK